MDLIPVSLEVRPIDHPVAASFTHPSHAGRGITMGLNRRFPLRPGRLFIFDSYAVSPCDCRKRGGGFFMGAT
ncbi:MAG: hypothetical protein WA624_22105 [Methylocella sp.]